MFCLADNNFFCNQKHITKYINKNKIRFYKLRFYKQSQQQSAKNEIIYVKVV